MYFQTKRKWYKDELILLIIEYSKKDAQCVGFIRNSSSNAVSIKWKKLN